MKHRHAFVAKYLRASLRYDGLLSTALRLLALTVLFAGCSEQGTREDVAVAYGCSHDSLRPLAEEPPSDIVLEVSDENRPCQLRWQSTGVALSGTSDEALNDPAAPIARAPDGTIATSAAYERGVVLVWHPNGDFGHRVGKLGQGPGELPAFGIALAYSSSDTLLLYGQGRWSYFDRSGAFLGSTPTLLTGLYTRGYWTLFSNGTIVVGTTHSAANRHSMSAISIAGETLRTFGEPMSTSADWRAERRLIARADDSSFWAAASTITDAEVVLERWALKGSLLQTIRFRAPWLKVSGSREATHLSSPPLPIVAALAVDEAGRLFFTTTVANDRWRNVADPREREKLESEWFDVRVDVVDPNYGLHVAQEGPLASEVIRSRYPQQIPNTSLAYVRDTTAAGMPSLALLELSLTSSKQ